MCTQIFLEWKWNTHIIRKGNKAYLLPLINCMYHLIQSEREYVFVWQKKWVKAGKIYALPKEREFACFIHCHRHCHLYCYETTITLSKIDQTVSWIENQHFLLNNGIIKNLLQHIIVVNSTQLKDSNKIDHITRILYAPAWYWDKSFSMIHHISIPTRVRQSELFSYSALWVYQ